MIHVLETQESADAWTEWARESGVHLTHPFMRPAFIAGYLKAKRKHEPLDPPHVEVLKDHNRFKSGVGCGAHCGEDLPRVTIHCRKECCHEKPGAYDHPLTDADKAVAEVQGITVDQRRCLWALCTDPAVEGTFRCQAHTPQPLEPSDPDGDAIDDWLRSRGWKIS